MADLFVVVTYDITNDRRRTRVHRALRRFGDPVEYSVFECRINAAQFERMRAEVDGLIRLDDDVRYYELCLSCARRIRTIGRAHTTRQCQAFLY